MVVTTLVDGRIGAYIWYHVHIGDVIIIIIIIKQKLKAQINRKLNVPNAQRWHNRWQTKVINEKAMSSIVCEN